VVAAPAIRSALDYDRAHFTSDGGLSGWFSPVRIADLASALLFYAPLAGLILVLAPSAVRADRRRAAVLLALGVPLLLLSFVVHPAHGVFRDIDVHAAAGAFAALLAAWAIAEFVSQAPENSRFGAAAVTTALALTIAWLALAHDVDRGVARVEAFVREPPTRSARDVAGAWDFLGFRLLELGRVDASAYAFERVADLQPTPRVLRQWASVELRRGNWDAVAAIWRGLLERDPANVRLWSEWLALAGRNGDVEGARAAAAAILRLDPTNAFAREALARLAAGRDSARTTER
jgi:tetratricopeptide (TPR) repeat protein